MLQRLTCIPDHMTFSKTSQWQQAVRTPAFSQQASLVFELLGHYQAVEHHRTSACHRFDYNNLVQGVGYLMAKLDSANKDKYMTPISSVMKLWLTAQSSISYTPKVRGAGSWITHLGTNVAGHTVLGH